MFTEQQGSRVHDRPGFGSAARAQSLSTAPWVWRCAGCLQPCWLAMELMHVTNSAAHMYDVVPPELLQALSHLLQEVAGGCFRHLPVPAQVVAQITTGTELEHKVQTIGILQAGTAA